MASGLVAGRDLAHEGLFDAAAVLGHRAAGVEAAPHGGGLSGLGTSPAVGLPRARLRCGSGIGTERISAWV